MDHGVRRDLSVTRAWKKNYGFVITLCTKQYFKITAIVNRLQQRKKNKVESQKKWEQQKKSSSNMTEQAESLFTKYIWEL